MPRAVWNGQVIADSDDTVVVEGNHYFPPDAVDDRFLEDSSHTTTCAWKGEASYRHVTVDDEVNRNAAWTYPDPSEAASEIQDHIAFWNGVEVVA